MGGYDTVCRRLLHGSVHRIVKALWTPSELQERLRALGWAIQVESSGAVYWGQRAAPVEPSVT